MGNKYLKLLRQGNAMFHKVANEINKPYLYVLCDYGLSYLFHRCGIRAYDVGKFYMYTPYMRRDTITAPRWSKLLRAFNDNNYAHYFENKVDFLKHFNKYISRSWFYCRGGGFEDFCAFVTKHERLIQKPIDDMQGHGVMLFDCGRDMASLRKKYDELITKNILLEEFITQHPKMVFANESVNTIRVYSFLDSKGGVHIVKAILRCGVGESVVDNYCRGGVIYPVDVETGIVEARGMSEDNRKFLYHPGDESSPMIGRCIPNWQKVLSVVEEAAHEVPQIRCVGWDIAITNEGVEMLEGNHDPHYELLEFIGRNRLYTEIKNYL